MPTYKFDCSVCGRDDLSQAVEPALRYIMDKSGRGASVQCCRDCVIVVDKQIKESREEKAREEKRHAKEERERAEAGFGTAGADTTGTP